MEYLEELVMIPWEKEAEEVLEKGVAQVPFLFRSRARTAASEKAALVAQEKGATSVSVDHVLTAIILITPAAYRDNLRQQFAKNGISLDKYEDLLG